MFPLCTIIPPCTVIRNTRVRPVRVRLLNIKDVRWNFKDISRKFQGLLSRPLEVKLEFKEFSGFQHVQGPVGPSESLSILMMLGPICFIWWHMIKIFYHIHINFHWPNNKDKYEALTKIHTTVYEALLYNQKYHSIARRFTQWAIPEQWLIRWKNPCDQQQQYPAWDQQNKDVYSTWCDVRYIDKWQWTSINNTLYM